jgi:D-lactate dehydrogenase
MRVAVFNSKSYDRQFLTEANHGHNHDFTFLEPRLSSETALLASGFPAVCAFINDHLDGEILAQLAAQGTQLIALRSAGFNNIDLEAAERLGITVVRVPAYSPYAVAEHAVGLILMLNRKLHKAYNRVRDDNFSLEGLIGFDLHGSTVGIIGMGKIGLCFARIMHGFGCHLLAYDVQPHPEALQLGVQYLPLADVLAASQIVSLHCPLLPSTYHLINAETLQQLHAGAMLINTSRGGLIDTQAVIQGIKSGQVGALGMDVYEQETELFFEDLSNTIIQDDQLQILQSFPNVVITAHQAFFTREAMEAIATTTLANISDIEQGRSCQNQILAQT